MAGVGLVWARLGWFGLALVLVWGNRIIALFTQLGKGRKKAPNGFGQ
jgi:hypothetical protein